MHQLISTRLSRSQHLTIFRDAAELKQHAETFQIKLTSELSLSHPMMDSIDGFDRSIDRLLIAARYSKWDLDIIAFFVYQTEWN